MAGKATTRTWVKRLGPAFDRATGAEPDPGIILALAKIMDQHEATISDDELDNVSALMYAAYEAGTQDQT